MRLCVVMLRVRTCNNKSSVRCTATESEDTNLESLELQSRNSGFRDLFVCLPGGGTDVNHDSYMGSLDLDAAVIWGRVGKAFWR
jgi:hypothetical protein